MKVNPDHTPTDPPNLPTDIKCKRKRTTAYKSLTRPTWRWTRTTHPQTPQTNPQTSNVNKKTPQPVTALPDPNEEKPGLHTHRFPAPSPPPTPLHAPNLPTDIKCKRNYTTACDSLTRPKWRKTRTTHPQIPLPPPPPSPPSPQFQFQLKMAS